MTNGLLYDMIDISNIRYYKMLLSYLDHDPNQEQECVFIADWEKWTGISCLSYNCLRRHHLGATRRCLEQIPIYKNEEE